MPWSRARKDLDRLRLGHDVRAALYRLGLSARQASKAVGKNKAFVQKLISGDVENVERCIELLDAKIPGFVRELAFVVNRRRGTGEENKECDKK